MLYNIVKAPIHSFPPPFAEQSPASPNPPLPAKSPVLKDLRDSGQSAQRQPGNSACQYWHFSVQYSRTHIEHMWDSHMILSKRAWPLQSSEMAEPTSMQKTTATAFILDKRSFTRRLRKDSFLAYGLEPIT